MSSYSGWSATYCAKNGQAAGPGWLGARTLDRVMNTAAPRIAALFTSAVLGLALLSGCSSDNVDCGLDQCTVTLERSTSASASVLGVEAKFVSANADTVTLEVAGEEIQLTKGQQAVDVGGLQVSLDSVTADAVQFVVAR
jgi:hypothetical protein